jgi:putative (di)nucleoside polyphosphate hydrolase
MVSDSERRNPGKLQELLADPIVWLVMQADGVDKKELMDMLQRTARKLADWGGKAMPGPSTNDSQDGGEGSLYRSGVGIMLLNQRNEVFVGRRLDMPGEAWQMPQGGIDEGEDEPAAAFRELKEEIGTDNAEIIAVSRNWLRYDWPRAVRVMVKGGRWLGQRQKWFVMRFTGSDSEINVVTRHPEFAEWKWIPLDRLPELIVEFKRGVYMGLLEEFGDIAPHMRSPATQ